MLTTLQRNIKIHPVTLQTLDMFVERVTERERKNLSKIILFGSVARGEANGDSDIDVLVILRKNDNEDRKNIIDIGVDVRWDMDFDDNAYLQPITISEEEAGGLDFYGLMRNVDREGVVLYDA